MTYIKDLISIPEHVGKGDFVLCLAEGVTDPEGTVKHYQVTPQLVKCFDEALKLVKGAVEGTSSKAAYLHGSFGSGKSHFMAVQAENPIRGCATTSGASSAKTSARE